MSSIGQRTGVQTTGTAFPSQPADWTWGYDALGQVTSADSPTSGFDRTYEYDQIGNRKKSADGALVTTGAATNYEPNELNQYHAIGAFVPSYDPDGNQKAAQILPLGCSSLVSCVYHWDAENRLVAVKDTNGADIVTYLYDSQSRRVARTEGSNTTIYLYDGWNCLAEYTLQNSSFNLHTSLTWGLDLSGAIQGAGGVGGLLAVNLLSSVSGSSVFFPTYDGNGNISEYLTASGSIAAHYEYDPFGRTIVESGPNAADFAYRFSTKPLDPATGFYYYGYRFYDPVTGRWINRDPIEEEGGVNLYGFCGNHGLDFVDPFGLEYRLKIVGGNATARQHKAMTKSFAFFLEKSVVDWKPEGENFGGKLRPPPFLASETGEYLDLVLFTVTANGRPHFVGDNEIASKDPKNPQKGIYTRKEGNRQFDVFLTQMVYITIDPNTGEITTKEYPLNEWQWSGVGEEAGDWIVMGSILVENRPGKNRVDFDYYSLGGISLADDNIDRKTLINRGPWKLKRGSMLGQEHMTEENKELEAVGPGYFTRLSPTEFPDAVYTPYYPFDGHRPPAGSVDSRKYGPLEKISLSVECTQKQK